MLGQKIKLSKKAFKDISLTANPGVYSHQTVKNINNSFIDPKNLPDYSRSVVLQKK
jgi:hypothetical protein